MNEQMREKDERAGMKDFLRLWPHLGKHWGWLALSGISMAVFAVTTAAYAWVIGPVLRFIFLPTGGPPPAELPEEIWSWLQDNRDLYPLILAGLVVGLALFRGVAQFGRGWCMGIVGQRVQLDIRRDVFERMLGIDPYRIIRMHKGDIQSRFVSDVVVLEFTITHSLTALMGDTVQVIALLGLALYLDPILGAISLLILPFSSLLIVFLGRRIRRSQLNAMNSLGDISSAVLETARGLPVIRAFGAEETMRRRFDVTNRDYYSRVLRAVLLGALSSPLMELIAAGALAATLWYARVRIGAGTLGSEQFVSFFAAIFLMYRPIKSLGQLNAMLNRGLAAARRIFGLLDEPQTPIPEGDIEAPAPQNSIRLENVSFSFDDEKVLDRLDLTIPTGKTTALVGASGAGKTTIAAMITRLLYPESGRVLWDDAPADDFTLASLRRHIAVVPQDPFLFHDTVRSNILLASPEATEDELTHALDLADAASFVEKLPGKLDEVVGEEGASLSGGERQRLCLARAALRDAPVLILDEAASSLDAASEEAIRTGLDQVASGRTVIVIGHRLSSVRDADTIAVLENGRIVEQGTYDELAQPGTAFTRLFESQF